MDRVQRRDFLIATVALLAAPLGAEAQQSAKLPRIGYLAFNSAIINRDVLIAFRQTLREFGWIDGQNIVIEARFADGEVDRLPALVDDLLVRNVELIAAGSSAATRASKAATATVPIVMLASADAVGEGFVASLARPGGNVTGMTFLAGPEIAAKQLGLLREIAPTASRLAFLMNPRNGSHAAFAAELKTAARKFGNQLRPVSAGSPNQLVDAFAAMTKARAEALLVLTDAMFLGERWTDHRSCSERSTTGVVRSKGVRRRRRAGFLRSELHRYEPRGSETCRQDPARRQAQGCSRRAADDLRAGHVPVYHPDET